MISLVKSFSVSGLAPKLAPKILTERVIWWVILKPMRKPFYRKTHKCWYVKDDSGAFVRLDPDESTAFDQWHQMRDRQRFDAPNSPVVGTFEAFFREHEDTMSPERFTKMVSFGTSFCKFVGPRTQTRKITRQDAKRWLDAPRTIRGVEGCQWSPARKRDAGQAVKRIFKWAFNEGHLSKNVLAELRLEQPEPRSQVVAPDTHAALIAETRKQDRSKPFGLFLIACHAGARPIQVREVTRENVSPCGTMWFFSRHKTKGKTGRALVVYLPPCLQTLTKILLANRDGHLFTNGQGKPYSKNAVVHRLARMREKLGFTGVIAYAYRHTFATDALLAGNDLATVAAMLGHKDTAMVSKVYGHLDQNAKHMHAAAAKTAAKRLQG
jgi:integrase